MELEIWKKRFKAVEGQVDQNRLSRERFYSGLPQEVEFQRGTFGKQLAPVGHSEQTKEEVKYLEELNQQLILDLDLEKSSKDQ